MNTPVVNSLVPPTLSGPTPIRETEYVILNTNNMVPYFTYMYRTYVRSLVPGGVVPPMYTITEAHFVLVCRYIVKGRCDYVFEQHSNEHRLTAIPPLLDLYMPKALANIVNSIGTVMVRNGAILLCPQPEDQPIQQNQWLKTTCTAAMLLSFEYFVSIIENKGIIKTGLLKEDIRGSSWYALRVSDLDGAVANGVSNHVRVYSYFREFEAVDVLYAIVVQTGVEGTNLLDTSFKWLTGTFRGIISARNEYNLHAD